MSAEMFQYLTKVTMTHIPYKGSGPAITDLLGGQVMMMFDNIPSALPHIKSGKLRALATTGAKRDPALATRFLKAYLRGVRDHNDSLVDGKFAGPKGDAVVAILTEYSLVKDPAVHRSFVLSAIHPDGKLDIPSMKEDLRIFRDAKLIEGKVEVEQGVDLSFLQAVLNELGPYKSAP
jgi:hypothetical protein